MGCTYSCLLELRFLLQHHGLPFPVRNPSSNGWDLIALADMPTRPTISSLLRTLHVAIVGILQVFGITEVLPVFFEQTGTGGPLPLRIELVASGSLGVDHCPYLNTC